MKDTNRLAIAGFVLSVCAAAAFPMAPICLWRLLFTPFFGFLANACAQILAAAGIAVSAVVNDRSRRGESGVGWSMAGLCVGITVLAWTVILPAGYFLAA